MEKYWKVFWAVVVSAAFLIVLAIIWPIAKLVYGDAIQKHKATVVLHTRAKVLGNESAQDQVKSRGVHSDAKDDLTSSRLRVAGAHLDQESTEMMVRETPYQDRFLRSVAWFYEARVGSKALTGKKELLILGTPVRVLFPEQTMLKEGFSEVLVRINILQPDGTERPGYVRVSRVSRKGQKQQSKFGGWWSVPIPEGSKMVVQKSVTLSLARNQSGLHFRFLQDAGMTSEARRTRFSE